MNTVTRKIRISLTGDNVKKVYESLYKWNMLMYFHSNRGIITTHRGKVIYYSEKSYKYSLGLILANIKKL